MGVKKALVSREKRSVGARWLMSLEEIDDLGEKVGGVTQKAYEKLVATARYAHKYREAVEKLSTDLVAAKLLIQDLQSKITQKGA